MQPSKQTRELIQAFSEALLRASADIEEAARILVQIVSNDPNGREHVLEACPSLKSDWFDGLLRIGRKQMYHELLFATAPGCKALRRCDYGEQVKYVSQPIELLLIRDRGPETLLAPVAALTPAQVKQVFQRSHIRSLGEQRIWLEAQKPKPRTVKTPEAYSVRRGRIEIHGPCSLDAADLARFQLELAKHSAR